MIARNFAQTARILFAQFGAMLALWAFFRGHPYLGAAMAVSVVVALIEYSAAEHLAKRKGRE